MCSLVAAMCSALQRVHDFVWSRISTSSSPSYKISPAASQHNAVTYAQESAVRSLRYKERMAPASSTSVFVTHSGAEKLYPHRQHHKCCSLARQPNLDHLHHPRPYATYVVDIFFSTMHHAIACRLFTSSASVQAVFLFILYWLVSLLPVLHCPPDLIQKTSHNHLLLLSLMQ